MKRRHFPSAALLPLLVLPVTARAQSPGAGVSAGYESYHFSDPEQTGMQTISLLTVPLAARVPLFGGAALDLHGAWARGSMRLADGSTVTLQGPTDTQLGLVLPLKRDVASLTAVALLPTGKQKETLDEALVAGVLASELLPFSISNWGAGGAAGMAAAVEHAFGRFGVGGSASYLVARRYDLLEENGFAYRPGNQLRARLALDATTGATGKASLQLTYLHSSEDAVDGSNLFRPGDRFQAMGSWAFAAGERSSGILYAGVFRRDQASFLVARPVQPPAQTLFMAGGGARLPVGRSVLLPSLDMRVLRRSDGLSQGVMAGLGGSAQIPLGGVTVLPEARARLGHVVVSEGSETGFTGFDLGLGVRFGGGRP